LTDTNKHFYASLIYNEDAKKITIEFTGFNNDKEAKSLCYILMEQFEIQQMNSHFNIPTTIH
tara:strand:- start:378 stop:563 length:186 start_codon:yes stop_codon:yes gene_type:complete